MGGHRKEDQRRADPCAGGFRKRAEQSHPAQDFPHCTWSDGYEKITKRR